MPPHGLSAGLPSHAPAISVIVPVYNVAGHVAACIDSLRRQTFTDFEAIVVDDGSSDDSPAQLRRAIGGDPRFVVIRQDNRGLSGARNTGLEAARGSFIAFIDGDDRYDPAFLERMHAALSGSDADWVACGLRNIHPDGHENTHSTIHTAPDLDAAEARLWPLGTWEEVIAHFPSAWNKLYRRALIDGLRFDEGTWFEDHTFFCRAAARTQTLLHLPEPLYLQTRGRAGQITATQSDRVFEQFAVLDSLSEIFALPGKSGGASALGQLAHRLVYERSTVLRDPELRQRFIMAARQWLAEHDISAAAPKEAPPSWTLEIEGGCPLSVVIPWDGQDAPLRATAEALAAQTLLGTEVLIVADDEATATRGVALAAGSGLAVRAGLQARAPGGPGAARNTGLRAARGEMIVFADAGDVLRPTTLADWTNEMLRQDADFGSSQFRIGVGQGEIHTGFHDARLFDPVPADSTLMPLSPDQALALHCHPTAKIYRRPFLIAQGLAFGTGALSAWPLPLAAALLGGRMLYFPWPGAESSEALEARQIWHRPVSARALAQALDITAPWTKALPSDWQRRLFARGLWEVVQFARMPRHRRIWLMLSALVIIRRRGWHRMPGPLDPYLSPRILRLMR